MNRFMTVAAGCLVAGCSTTSLTVKKAVSDETRVGAPYPLMFSRFQIEVTRQVVECGAELKAMTKAEVKAVEAAPDPNQMFMLDTNSLANAMKTSEVKLEYHPSGAVASLNATATDHTGPVISNVAASVFKVVSIAAGAGAAAAAPEACKDSVRKALSKIAELKPDLETKTLLVERLTKDMKALLEKVALASGNADARTKRALSTKYDALMMQSSELKEMSESMAKLLKVVTYVETIYWPKNGDTFMEEIPLPKEILNRWGVFDDDEKKSEKERAKFSVFLDLSAVALHGRQAPSEPQIVNPELGIPYRLPVAGTLTVCAEKACGIGDVGLTQKTGDVLQLGNIFYLPCRSRPFSDIGCSFAILETGQLKSMGVVNKTATAVGATAAVKDVLGQAGTLKADLDAADLKKLQAETALLKAEAEYIAAEAALKPDSLQSDKDATAALKAQTDLVNAQLALLQAKKALSDAMSAKEQEP